MVLLNLPQSCESPTNNIIPKIGPKFSGKLPFFGKKAKGQPDFRIVLKI